jgi:hypothetical protein
MDDNCNITRIVDWAQTMPKGEAFSAPMFLQERLQEAIDNLEDQCAYAFKRYKHALNIIAVAVAGDYWQYALVTFNTVSPLNDDFTLVRTAWD